MTLRALLIGAQTYGLTGVHADVALMRRVLVDRGFTDLDVRTGERARYAGIIEGMARLRRAVRPEDGVVVYYSGHGGLTDGLQYLVPVDMGESTPTDFRGYLAEELTAAVRALTEVTPNVTCVLDCCHSGGAVREAAYDSGRWALKSVQLPRVPPDAALARAALLAGPDDPLVPDVVRLTACEQHGSAYEAELRYGAGRQGVFTAALADLLDATADRPIPWAAVVARARDRIKQQQVLQWPDAGGPSGRLPFSLEEPSEPERLPLERREGRFRVPGGALFGLGPEDELSLVFPDDTAHREDGGTSVPATVEEMRGGDALLRAKPTPVSQADELSGALVPPGSYALAVRVHDRRQVLIDAVGPFADALREELTHSPRLAETREAHAAFAVVRLRDGRPEVLDRAGLPVRRPTDPAYADPSRLLALVDELARGERVRWLRDPQDASRLDAAADVQFEARRTTGDGGWRALGPMGERLHDGDLYRVTVYNRSRTPLYFWVLGVGLSGRTSLVTNDQPSGYRVEPGSRRATAPVRVYWPADVPETGPRPETIHLIAGDRRMDLGALASREGRDRSAPTAAPALGALLQEVWDAVRDQRLDGDEEFHYRVWTVHADALPRPRGGGA
ncbi:caspase domain-containing protein [Streptomyces sp. WSLK1-3]|uniref:caspase domain-containing protein n=1 Tax=Streptomyces sp. WSLK1-3 TaxID=3375475 RepID=UPI00378D4099